MTKQTLDAMIDDSVFWITQWANLVEQAFEGGNIHRAQDAARMLTINADLLVEYATDAAR